MEFIKEGYARVSDILSIFQAYAHVDRKKLKKAQDIGTDIHEAIENYFNNGFTPLNDKKGLYFESFLKYAATVTFEHCSLENRLYDDTLMITGKPDYIGLLNGVPVILDWKTGSWAHPQIWKLQGTFYRYLSKFEDIDYFVFIKLSPDGTEPRVFPFQYDPEDWEVCLAALKAYHYFKT